MEVPPVRGTPMPGPLWETGAAVCILMQKHCQPGGSHRTAGDVSITTHCVWGTGALLQGETVVTLARQCAMTENLPGCRSHSSHCYLSPSLEMRWMELCLISRQTRSRLQPRISLKPGHHSNTPLQNCLLSLIFLWLRMPRCRSEPLPALLCLRVITL